MPITDAQRAAWEKRWAEAEAAAREAEELEARGEARAQEAQPPAKPKRKRLTRSERAAAKAAYAIKQATQAHAKPDPTPGAGEPVGFVTREKMAHLIEAYGKARCLRNGAISLSIFAMRADVYSVQKTFRTLRRGALRRVNFYDEPAHGGPRWAIGFRGRSALNVLAYGFPALCPLHQEFSAQVRSGVELYENRETHRRCGNRNAIATDRTYKEKRDANLKDMRRTLDAIIAGACPVGRLTGNWRSGVPDAPPPQAPPAEPEEPDTWATSVVVKDVE